MKSTNCIIIFLVCITSTALSQEFSANSIKTGFGLGGSFSDATDGFGLLYSIGFQKELKNDRFRFNPNFSIGHYSSKGMLDARDLYFNSINLQGIFTMIYSGVTQLL